MSVIDDETAVMAEVRKHNALESPDVLFHDHLETCEQCREHPFNLCAAGHALLIAVVPVDGTINWPRISPGAHDAQLVQARVSACTPAIQLVEAMQALSDDDRLVVLDFITQHYLFGRLAEYVTQSGG